VKVQTRPERIQRQSGRLERSDPADDRDSGGFVLRHRSKPYVNGKLFMEEISIIFISYLNELWDSREFAECEAVLLMDKCSPHIGEAVLVLLTDGWVRIVTSAPHATQIFQVLDMVLFGALKKHATSLTMLDEEQPAAAFLIKVSHDSKQTMVEATI
jgi:hypothetical protein